MVASSLVSIQKGDIMFLIDLKDACIQSLIHLESRPYLQFMVNKIHQFKSFVLWPFSLKVGSLERHSITSVFV